jgi:hypothetical protein
VFGYEAYGREAEAVLICVFKRYCDFRSERVFLYTQVEGGMMKGQGDREGRDGVFGIGQGHMESESVLKIFHSRKLFQIFYSE